MSDAAEFWQQHGLRDDGKPNRPLTAFTVKVLPSLSVPLPIKERT